MSKPNYPENWNDIDTGLYYRSVKIFNQVRKLLSVKMQLHADEQVEKGDIFLFNHFSRFETFIPQFLIYEQSGAYCCAIASGEFFKEDNVLARYLGNVGVFPHNHPRLFQLLAAQILRGRKVIIFPEGGMVKDHRVMDKKGRYSVYSRITGERRKHHTGAAVLAQGVEIFKHMVRSAYQNKNQAQLMRWKEQLQLDSLDQLLTSALKPTLIVPSNITFYPIRSSENLLLTSVELFSNGLSMRQTEELLVEGNIIFRNTDMDIRMGEPLNPLVTWGWRARALQNQIADELDSLDDVFSMPQAPKNWKHKLLGAYLKKSANKTRNQYMEEIYRNVTVNLSHLASTLIMHCVENGIDMLERRCFFTALYIGVKTIQTEASIHLHRSLLRPNEYANLHLGKNGCFEHFIEIAKNAELIEEVGDHYRFLPKLLEEHDFDLIRLENLIAVYNNEVKPIAAVGKTMVKALKACEKIDAKQIAAWQFEDEKLALKCEQHIYCTPAYEDINDHETASEDPTPFFLEPAEANGVGVLLIHGLLASPAELKGYGEHLLRLGYTVLGIRLKGHGSSPYALRDQSWQDWYASVEHGFDILKTHADKIVVTGFSTGGALALKLASENHPEIIGVSAAAVPLKFINSTFMLVPLLHGTNRFVDWVSSYEGVKPFIENVSEHPRVNYRYIPVRGLYELRLLIQQMDDFLPKIKLPVFLMQGDKDPVVSAKSAPEVMNKLKTPDKQLKILRSDRHGVLMENIDGAWQLNDAFIERCMHATNAGGLGQTA